MSGDPVSIKGTPEGLVIMLDANHELEEIKKYLQQKMEAAKGFFKGAKFTIYRQHRDIPPGERHELEAICRRYGLIPNYKINIPYAKTHQKGILTKKTTQKVHFFPYPSGVPTNMTSGPALLHNNNLRSGQNLNYPGHVIVVGNVHHGAEIFAGGSVAVMGICRGSVHAGIYGDKSARIIAYRLAPAVLSIAGVPARSTPQNSAPCSYPEVAHLQNNKIIVERYRHTLKTTTR